MRNTGEPTPASEGAGGAEERQSPAEPALAVDEEAIFEDLLASPPSPDSPLRAQAMDLEPLLRSLHLENFKSLAGPHTVPLAPLTLIYGPNAAGKSSILQVLRLFLQAVRVGQHNALGIYEQCFGDEDVALWEVTSGNDQTLPLVLGSGFVEPSGQVAHATLGFYDNTHVGVLTQTSVINSEEAPEASKVFQIDYSELDSGSVEPLFKVGPDEDSLERVHRDNKLFAVPDGLLTDRLFDLAAHTVFLGPHRGDPKRLHETSGQRFRRHPGNRDFADLAVLNSILKSLDVPYRFEVPDGAGGTADSDRWIEKWQLVDTRNGVKVRLDQVGYGVSQLLPVIEACARATGQVISIEQPELHLHPRLQSKLGDLFKWSIRRSRNQLIVETHSENILLRVRKLVRQGHLRPTDVSVIYVDNRSDEGATVQRLRLGERGELLDPWPTGFFDDSLDDVLGGCR